MQQFSKWEQYEQQGEQALGPKRAFRRYQRGEVQYCTDRLFALRCHRVLDPIGNDAVSLLGPIAILV